ncbi:MAG: Lon-like protease helical domain-containing protein [Desulfohalobiaceae bacterium]
MSVQRLQARDLTQALQPEELALQSTKEIEPIEDLGRVLGQPRAVEALHFGTGMPKQGFNIFVLGPSGTGRHALAKEISSQRALQKEPPADWCYVNNFQESTRPRVLMLPSGQGRKFVQDVQNMVLEARNSLKAAFESEEYQNRVQALEQELKDQQQQAFQELQQKAQDKGLSMVLQEGLSLNSPVMIIYSGSKLSRRAVQMALNMARAVQGEVLALIPAKTESAYQARRTELAEQFPELSSKIFTRQIKAVELESLLAAVQAEQGSPLVLPVEEEHFSLQDLQSLIDKISSPVLLVRYSG